VKTISCIKIASSGLITSNTATAFIDDDIQLVSLLRIALIPHLFNLWRK
jgi:hypothetical protein